VGPIWLLQREHDQIGTLVKLEGPGTAHWIPFFAADNVDQQAARAAELGARVLVPPVTVPRGRAAVIADPQGAVLALFQTIPG
jgi:predicted enzyme related to lactoylglutathione lyase